MNKIKTYFDNQLLENNLNETKLFSFGCNDMGQLGVPNDSQYIIKNQEQQNISSQAINIEFFNDIKVKTLSIGDQHSICISSSGAIYSWGAFTYGQLGVEQNPKIISDPDGFAYQPSPLQIQTLRNYKVIDVACGDAHTLALINDGQIFSWGGAGCGQLGHQNLSQMPRDSDACPYQPYPKLIESLKGTFIIKISCGKAHSIAIDNNYNLYTWGAGACGQLGVEDIHTLPVDDDGYPFQPIPKISKILKGKEIIKGSCGDVHTVVLTKKGEVYSFGGGSFGQLGLGAVSKMPLDSDSYPFMPTPTRIESLNGIDIVDISCGDSHTMAIDKEGKLYSWGAAACGQLGIDNLATLPKDGEGNPYEADPKLVTFFENMKVIQVSCGESHTLVLIEGGIVFSFGNSNSGQLGFIEKKDKSQKINKPLENSILLGKPRLITSLIGLNIVKVTSGGSHNICIISNELKIEYEIYKYYKEDKYTDIELVLDNSGHIKGEGIFKLSCHKIVLFSKSDYFKQNTSFRNIKPEVFKSFIEYFYINDCSFISDFNSTEELIDCLKLAKQLGLSVIQKKIEEKLKGYILKYSEALIGIDKLHINLGAKSNSSNEIIKSTINNKSNGKEHSDQEASMKEVSKYSDLNNENFKGLFFLPNGKPFLILDQDLINKISNSSYLLNVNVDHKKTNENEILSPVSCINLPYNSFKNEFFYEFNKIFSSLPSNSNIPFHQLLIKYGFLQNSSSLPIYLSLFNDKDTSDLIIKVENYIFYCHKVSQQQILIYINI